MNNLTVIIPSNTASNLIPCIQAVQIAEPEAKIIVIDDGISGDWTPDDHRIVVMEGVKPFCFPRACNMGMRASDSSDVILLNDDALLKTTYGFTLLQAEADRHPEFGIISSTTNVAGNRQQFPKAIGLRETDRSVAFVCVFIPRRTIDRIGLMDEQFGGNTPDGRRIYGYCDTDYVRRVRMAGLKIGIHDGCFVDHESLQSSFRGSPHAPGDVGLSQELYLAKWGDLS